MRIHFGVSKTAELTVNIYVSVSNAVVHAHHVSTSKTVEITLNVNTSISKSVEPTFNINVGVRKYG